MRVLIQMVYSGAKQLSSNSRYKLDAQASVSTRTAYVEDKNTEAQDTELSFTPSLCGLCVSNLPAQWELKFQLKLRNFKTRERVYRSVLGNALACAASLYFRCFH